MNEDAMTTEVEDQWYAAVAVGRGEMELLTDAVIEHLKKRPPIGLNDDVVTRHLWDEFSWCRETGLMMSQFLPVIGASVSIVLETVSRERFQALTAYSVENTCDGSYDEYRDDGQDEVPPVGIVCEHVVVEVCLEKIQERAYKRNVHLLGYEMFYEVMPYTTLPGGACEDLLYNDEFTGVLCRDLLAVIDPERSMLGMAGELADMCLAAFERCEVPDEFMAFVGRHKGKVREHMIQQDILPALVETRAAILAVLDP